MPVQLYLKTEPLENAEEQEISLDVHQIIEKSKEFKKDVLLTTAKALSVLTT